MSLAERGGNLDYTLLGCAEGIESWFGSILCYFEEKAEL